MTRGRAASLAPERLGARTSADANRRTLPLWCDHLRGGGRSRDDRHLPLHRLPRAHRDGVPGDGEGSGRAFRPSREADDLREDGGQRPEASARVLPDVRLADLRDVGGESDGVQPPARDDPPAEGVRTSKDDLVRFCPALVDGPRRTRSRAPRASALTPVRAGASWRPIRIEQVAQGKECDAEGSARQVDVVSRASLEPPPHRREPVERFEEVSQDDHDEASRANELQVRAERPRPRDSDE